MINSRWEEGGLKGAGGLEEGGSWRKEGYSGRQEGYGAKI